MHVEKGQVNEELAQALVLLADDEHGEKGAVDDVLTLLLAVLCWMVWLRSMPVDAVKVDEVLIGRDLY